MSCPRRFTTICRSRVCCRRTRHLEEHCTLRRRSGRSGHSIRIRGFGSRDIISTIRPWLVTCRCTQIRTNTKQFLAQTLFQLSRAFHYALLCAVTFAKQALVSLDFNLDIRVLFIDHGHRINCSQCITPNVSAKCDVADPPALPERLAPRPRIHSCQHSRSHHDRTGRHPSTFSCRWPTPNSRC